MTAGAGEDEREFLVLWPDGPGSERGAPCIGVAEVVEQLRLLATSRVQYTLDHADEIVVIEHTTDGNGFYKELARMTPERFRAREENTA